MITCRGASCGALHISSERCYINGNAMALDDLNEEAFDIRFLFHYLTKRGFEDVISGSAQPQITRQGLLKVKIPCLPLPEQKRIAAILDKADSLRRKRQQAIRLADDFLRAVFLEMFGKKERSDTLGSYMNALSGFAFKSDSYVSGDAGARLLRGVNVGLGAAAA